jgi:hypothetical protein
MIPTGLNQPEMVYSTGKQINLFLFAFVCLIMKMKHFQRALCFNCFEGKDPGEVVSKLRERFCPDLNKSQTVAYALDLIKFATASYGTKQYDYYQYLSQGIAT